MRMPSTYPGGGYVARVIDPPTVAADALPAGYADPRLAGEGTFGRVYRARDAQGRDVAVKVLAPALVADPSARWQFHSEFRRLARLGHPAFPRAHEEGTTPAGAPCYSMDFVEGSPPEAV